MCVILCLFSVLSRRVGALQTSVIIITETTQIISGRVSVITFHNAYTSANKTKIVGIETELIYYPCFDAICFHKSVLRLFRRFCGER